VEDEQPAATTMPPRTNGHKESVGRAMEFPSSTTY
jgi:hypothetical protein